MREYAREKTYLIFDNKYYSPNIDTLGKRAVSIDAQLITNNYLQLAELRNRHSHFRNTIIGAFLKSLINQKMQAVQLIKLIEMEYD